MKIVKIEEEPFHLLKYRSSGRNGVERKVQLPFYRVKVDLMPAGIKSIVMVSDLQGREEDERNRLVGEAVADELELLCELQEIEAVSCVFLAGDLYDYPDCRKLGGTGDVTSVWNAFAKIAPFVVGVHGNHDIVQEKDLASNVVVLDGEVKKIAGLNVGGVSGIVGREDRNQRKSESAFQKALQKALTDKTEVMLLHQGPDDPINNQIGDPLTRSYLEKKGRALVVFGHCHWSVPLIEIGNNQVLNVDNRLYVLSE